MIHPKDSQSPCLYIFNQIFTFCCWLFPVDMRRGDNWQRLVYIGCVRLIWRRGSCPSSTLLLLSTTACLLHSPRVSTELHTKGILIKNNYRYEFPKQGYRCRSKYLVSFLISVILHWALFQITYDTMLHLVLLWFPETQIWWCNSVGSSC